MFYQPPSFFEDLLNLRVALVLNSLVSGMVFILNNQLNPTQRNLVEITAQFLEKCHMKENSVGQLLRVPGNPTIQQVAKKFWS